MIPCSWKETFGVDCPGCGAQRSFLELMDGNMWGSMLLYPALVPLIFLVIYCALHIWKPRLFPAKLIVISVIFVGVLIFGNWIVKLIF